MSPFESDFSPRREWRPCKLAFSCRTSNSRRSPDSLARRFPRSARASILGSAASARRASAHQRRDRKSTRLNSSHLVISYAVFCLKKKKNREKRLANEGTLKRDVNYEAPR